MSYIKNWHIVWNAYTVEITFSYKGLDTQNAMQICNDITANSHRARLTHRMQIRGKNHTALTHTMKTLCMYMGKQFTHYVHAKAFGAKTVFAPKTICVGSSHSFWISEFTTTMGEALIDLVQQYPTLWDKQDIMYKDSSYKEAKWKEIAEILQSQ